MSVSIAELSSYLDAAHRSASTRLAQFKSSLEEHAFSALEASELVFESVAQLRVISTIRRQLANGMAIDAIVDVATREAVSAARFPKRSTSPTSNLISQCLAAAWGEAAALVGGSL